VNLRRHLACALDVVSRVTGRLADYLDPPVPVDPALDADLTRIRQQARELLQSQARHPAYQERPQTLLGDVAAPQAPLAEVVPLRPEEPQ
jgi:hypothetical protein